MLKNRIILFYCYYYYDKSKAFSHENNYSNQRNPSYRTVVTVTNSTIFTAYSFVKIVMMWHNRHLIKLI